MVKIAVLGAGVNGLACAVQIKEKYKNFQVKIISDDFTPNTTGDGSGGLWYPYSCGTTPSKMIEQWGGETLAFFHDLWLTGEVKICLMPLFYLSTEKQFTLPDWLRITYGYQELNDAQLKYYRQRHSRNYTAGLTFVTFVTSPPQLLAYLTKRFKEANGEILQAKISSLQDPILKEFDIIINCTGLGAKFLLSDEKMTSIRGQILKVKAPWLSEVIQDESGHYVIPNVEACVLGGTQQNSYDTKLDPKDSDFILDGCNRLYPGLKDVKVDQGWVGLRPVRESVRLEPELIDGKLYIHNYGHGGSGFTLFWGCSNQVLQILDTYLKKNYVSHRTSKL